MTDELDRLRGALTEYFSHVWREFGADDEAFADALGVSESLVYQLRRGRKNVTIEHLAQLAAVQKVPVLAALAEVAALMARQMGPEIGIVAPGSTEGSAVTPELAARMRPSEVGAVKPPQKAPKPRDE